MLMWKPSTDLAQGKRRCGSIPGLAAGTAIVDLAVDLMKTGRVFLVGDQRMILAPSKKAGELRILSINNGPGGGFGTIWRPSRSTIYALLCEDALHFPWLQV